MVIICTGKVFKQMAHLQTCAINIRLTLPTEWQSVDLPGPFTALRPGLSNQSEQAPIFVDAGEFELDQPGGAPTGMNAEGLAEAPQREL